MRVVLFILFFVGAGLFWHSLNIPYYKDENLAHDLRSRSYELPKPDYYKRDAQLRTNKTSLMDTGAGLMIASAAILLFFKFAGTRSLKDFKKLRPLSRIHLITLSNLVWFSMIPANFWYYSFRLGRGDYPPFADSILIGIYQSSSFFLLLMIPLNIFILVTLRGSVSPDALLVRAGQYTLMPILWEIFFGIWILINLCSLVMFVIDGDHFSIPVILFFTYVLLSLRARQIARWANVTALTSTD